jgi:homoserine dehydrogenase
MDGAPIFSLFREPLPCVDLLGFKGILNSCTNYILGLIAEGKGFDEAVAMAQQIGIAETDPSGDIEGWDAAIKVAALVTVLMGIPLKPQNVDRTGISAITPAMIAEAQAAGERWKLVCTARRDGERLLEASVKPERVSAASPMYSVDGTSSFIQFKLDVLPGLGVLESNPGPDTTAFGLLADLLNALRSE